MDKLKKAMIAAVDRSRLRCATFGPAAASWSDVDVLKATEQKLVLFDDGQAFEARWDAIPPRQVYDLAEALLGPSPAPGDRFGLGLFCLKNKMTPEARRIFESLATTDLGPSRASTWRGSGRPGTKCSVS